MRNASVAFSEVRFLGCFLPPSGILTRSERGADMTVLLVLGFFTAFLTIDHFKTQHQIHHKF